MISVESLVADLQRNAQAIAQFVDGLDPTEARWKPSGSEWSILETICHLRDEEREDFRARITHLIEARTSDWPGIDPEGWVTQRNYQNDSLGDALRSFLDAREDSVSWLNSLKQPDWNRAFDHPAGYPIRAGDIAVSWAAHDVLHLRQLSRIRFAQLTHEADPYTTLYAGQW